MSGSASASDHRLEVLARARWPEDGDGPPPKLPGFVVSSFSPLVAAVAERCLRRWYGEPPAGERIAVVVASRCGDVTTLDAVRRAIAERKAVAPLLFFQSVPTAVAGHVAARWGLGGPVVCTSPLGAEDGDAFALARLLVDDGDADGALVVVAEQSVGGAPDRASAVLVGGADARRPEGG